MEKALTISNRIFGILCLAMTGIVISASLNQNFADRHIVMSVIMLVIACGFLMLVRAIINAVIRASFGKE